MSIKSIIVPIVFLTAWILPALSQTVADAQKQAVAKYPDLAREGSRMHAKFMEMYQQAKDSNSPLLTDPNWPLTLADKASDLVAAPATPSTRPSTPDLAKPAIAAGSSQQAIPPQKPIEVRSEIGETATTRGKVHIAIRAVVTSQDIACSVVIQDTQFLGGEFRIAPAEIGDFATLVQTASDKLLAGQSFSGKTPNTAVEVSNKKGEFALTISFERKGFNLSTSSITMDADNAATLARLVTRARQTIDWLAPRLKYIQPSKP